MASKTKRPKLSKEQDKFLSTVEDGTLAKVQQISLETQLLNKAESFDYLLLVTALRRGHKTISKYLMKNGCVVKAPTETKTHCTPLYYAVEMDDLEIFKALLRKGASIFDKDYNKDTALELAMSLRKVNIVKCILDDYKSPKNSSALKPDCQNHVALFHAACWMGDLEAIQMFISLGFSGRSRSTFTKDEWKGFTPLHFALTSKSGTLAILLDLLKHDVDLCAMDKRGRTCFHLGFRSQYHYLFRNSIVIDCLKNSSESQFINPVDENGLSHLHMLCLLNCSDEDDAAESLDLIRHYIDSGADVNSCVSLDDDTYPGYTAAHFAAVQISYDVLKLLLERGADPNKSDNNGATPLHLVCTAKLSYDDERRKIDCERRFETVKLLLQYGADPVAKDSQNCTPLHRSFGEYAIVRALDDSEKFLLSMNPLGMNHTDNYGVSYLHIACTGDDFGIVQTLVLNGAQVNSPISPHSRRYAGFSALHFAVSRNSLEFVKFLLDHGADVNAVDERGCTPLHLACDHEPTELVYGSHEGYKETGNDAHWLSTRQNHIKIIETLIDRGADVIAENYSNFTPLSNVFDVPCILYGNSFWYHNQEWVDSFQDEMFLRQKQIMDILLQHGADINSCECSHGSILHLLAYEHHKYMPNSDLAEIILKRGADPNAVNGRGSTPLHIAVFQSINKSDVTCMIDTLLNLGANVNSTDRNLNTPLHEALKEFGDCPTSDDVYKKLLDHPNININAQNERKETFLHLAIGKRNLFCTKKLLESGADINLENVDGHPPIYYLTKQLAMVSDARRGDGIQEIINITVGHVKKMLILQLNISDKVMNHYDVLMHHPSLPKLKLMDAEIDLEMQRLKTQKLNTCTTLFDILSKDTHAVAKLSMNEEFKAAVLSIHNGQDYKHFGKMIKKKYEEGLKRFKVLEPAKEALNHATNRDWPNCCSEEIISHLCYESLEKLILATDVHESLKRSNENHGSKSTDSSSENSSL